MSDLKRAVHLCLLLIADMIEVEQLADLFQAEAKTLATQNQLKPSAVALGEQAFLPVTFWKESSFAS